MWHYHDLDLCWHYKGILPSSVCPIILWRKGKAKINTFWKETVRNWWEQPEVSILPTGIIFPLLFKTWRDDLHHTSIYIWYTDIYIYLSILHSLWQQMRKGIKCLFERLTSDCEFSCRLCPSQRVFCNNLVLPGVFRANPQYEQRAYSTGVGD